MNKPGETIVRARRGGTRYYCPVILDLTSGEMCPHPSRAMNARGARAIRRHVRRDHLEPFKVAREGFLAFAFTGRDVGFPGTKVQLTMSKGRPAQEEDDY